MNTNVLSLCYFLQQFCLNSCSEKYIHIIGATDIEYNCTNENAFKTTYSELIKLLRHWVTLKLCSNGTIHLNFIGPELINTKQTFPIMYQYDTITISIEMNNCYYHDCIFNHAPDIIILFNAGITCITIHTSQ